MLATLLLLPGYLTFVRTLAALWASSVQKWSLYNKERNFENRGRKYEQNGGQGQKI